MSVDFEGFESELQRDFPQLCGSAMLGAPPGWQVIVRHLCEQLRDEPVRFRQIKEKWAQLTLYYDTDGPLSPTALAAIKDAERECAVTCDRCGDVGRLMRRERTGWFFVRCPVHAGDGKPVEA